MALFRTTSAVKSKKRDRNESLASYSDAHRHKRKHRGAWYEEERGLKAIKIERSPRKVQKPRGPFQRNFDSGVWLGSDESLDTDGAEYNREEADQKAFRVMEMGGSVDEEEGELAQEADNELESEPQEDDAHAVLYHKAMQTTEDPEHFEGPIFPYWQKQPDNLKGYHTWQQIAQRKVSECVESGDEAVDLS